MNKYQVSVAAEAVVAALFAREGYDVSVQYGANQPGYDLVALKDDKMLKVSVKGSQDGGWILTGGFKKGRSNLEAADEWLRRHGCDMVFAFVQFKDVEFDKMPRVFVARGSEVAERLKAARNGEGNTVLWEERTHKSGIAKGCSDCIPTHWRFSQERINSV